MDTYNLVAEGRTGSNLKKLKEEKILDKAAHKETRKFLKGTLAKHFLTAATGIVAFGAATVITFNTAMNAHSQLGALAMMGSIFAAVALVVTPIITTGNFFEGHYKPAFKAIRSDLKSEQQRQIKDSAEKAPEIQDALGATNTHKKGGFLGRSRVKPSA